MNKKEALEILSTRENKFGKIDDMKVYISPEDISLNLEMSDYELDMELIQDLTSYSEIYGFEMLQGHSLGEVILDQE